MLLQNMRIRETNLFTYEISSADMRHIAINERHVYLRNTEKGPILRGEICDAYPQCYVNLSQILLEYAISCEGCKDSDDAIGLVECMGKRVGRLIAKKLYQDTPELTLDEQVGAAFNLLFQSMDVEFQMLKTPNTFHYIFTDDPLLVAAQQTNLLRSIVPARHGFLAICSSMLEAITAQGSITQPTDTQTKDPIYEIMLQF